MDINTKIAIKDFAHRWRTDRPEVQRIKNQCGMAFALILNGKIKAGISQKTYESNKTEIDAIICAEMEIKEKVPRLKDARFFPEQGKKILERRSKLEKSINFDEDDN